MKARPNSSASSFEEIEIYQGDHKALLASAPLQAVGIRSDVACTVLLVHMECHSLGVFQGMQIFRTS